MKSSAIKARTKRALKLMLTTFLKQKSERKWMGEETEKQVQRLFDGLGKVSESISQA